MYLFAILCWKLCFRFFSHDDSPRLKQLSINQWYISTRGYCSFESLILIRVLFFFRKKKMEMAKSLNTTAVKECARSYRAHHTIFVVWHKPAETWPKWILDILTWSLVSSKTAYQKNPTNNSSSLNMHSTARFHAV